nr:MAG TPA_asm: hypothetical protein [Caudoviricetes sp.]
MLKRRILSPCCHTIVTLLAHTDFLLSAYFSVTYYFLVSFLYKFL